MAVTSIVTNIAAYECICRRATRIKTVPVKQGDS